MIEALRKLGLSDLEARCYLALHGQPPSSGYEVAKQVSVSRSNVYAALRSLVDKGVCRAVEGEPITFTNIPIGQVIKLLQADFEHTARLLESELTALPAAPPFFSNWKGGQQVELAVRRLTANAREEILVDLWAEDLHRVEEALLAAERRGIAVHLMVIGEAPTGLKRVIVHSVPQGGPPKSRNFSLLLDKETAILGSFSSHAPPSALESNHPAVLNVLETSYYHDVVMMRIEADFASELEERYGKDYDLIRREHPEMLPKN
ncbi:helix-turn-helix domain-containing protein [Paenibacillus sp. MMS20-IR301]|uniref:TrmB family transcriptional regulator n=1 Tax=Paenibacillus sp. MMS20-IR301 TaxID=2895946 RepID=UPI0028E6225A|nr:helix-turn-helix domain-containing protein [Paenibacillus sp. MMS20-IR301]WNS45235.1 helix-turn-helix domain-containing protein [Paenibacillus sp. MMS20-IR301]